VLPGKQVKLERATLALDMVDGSATRLRSLEGPLQHGK
jgi:hypothetical protein